MKILVDLTITYSFEPRSNLDFHLGQVVCTGNEATILSCGSFGLGVNQNCSSGQVVWLKCETRMPGVSQGFC